MKRPDIRYTNARAWAMSIGGPAAFAQRMGMSDSQASQIIGENPTRNIGKTIAERIEKEFGQPPGSLDIPPETTVIDMLDQYPSQPDVEGLITQMREASDNGMLTPKLIGVFSGILDIVSNVKNADAGNRTNVRLTGKGSVTSRPDAVGQVETGTNSGEKSERSHRGRSR